MTARGLAFLYGGESQCGERQDADPAILRAASDACERRIDPEAAGLGYLAGNESEGALDQTKQGRIRGAGRVAHKFVQNQARGGGEIERGAVGEGNADGAIGFGLNRIAPVDEIADADSNNLAVGAHDGDRTDRRPDFADGFEGRGGQSLSGTHDDAIARHMAATVEHLPLPGDARANSLRPFLCLKTHDNRATHADNPSISRHVMEHNAKICG